MGMPTMPNQKLQEVILELLRDPEQELLLNVQDLCDHTPLHYAILNQDRYLTNLFIKSGAKVTQSHKDLAATKNMSGHVRNAAATHQAMVFTVTSAVSSKTGMIGDVSGVVVDYLSKFELC